MFDETHQTNSKINPITSLMAGKKYKNKNKIKK